MKPGTLYGIGVGPGAPDLLTLRAVNALSKVNVILAAASPKNDYSLALEIARPHLPAQIDILRLDFPMTRDQDILQTAWQKAAASALAVLEQGANAAFLTLGDPLIYSTFSYLLAAVRKLNADISVEIVSGITSFQAAAAQCQLSLCEGSEHLQIISGIVPEQELQKLLAQNGPAVILKVYRNLAAIKSALGATGRNKDAIWLSHVEQANAQTEIGADACKNSRPPYMTLIISKTGQK